MLHGMPGDENWPAVAGFGSRSYTRVASHDHKEVTMSAVCHRTCTGSVVSPAIPTLAVAHKRSPMRKKQWAGWAGWLAALLCGPALAFTELPQPDSSGGISSPALGIDTTFGRWKDTVRLVYDPDDAPEAFADTKQFLTLLDAAISQWQRVSGIRIEVVGADASVPDDRNLSVAQSDGLVRVFWGDAGGAAGRAGPSYNSYDYDLGYYPYHDGSLELNHDADSWESDFELVVVLAHELGHLLGLGHSDNPASIMYANPYNHLAYPREDDIRAMQVLYGPPAAPFDPRQPLPEWLYEPPPMASAEATRYLFKRNQSTVHDARFVVGAKGDVAVTQVDATTPDADVLWLHSGGIGNFNHIFKIDLDATVVVVDPYGYPQSVSGWELDCPPQTNCGYYFGIKRVDRLKTQPGIWRVYVLDEKSNPKDPRTLLSLSIPVYATPALNRAPQAMVTVQPGTLPDMAVFTISATDADGDAVEIRWRPPRFYDLDANGRADTHVRDKFASGGSATRAFNFGLIGTHEFFIEVNDDTPRYEPAAADGSSPGDGFRTLLKVRVTLLPGVAPGMQVVATSDEGGSTAPRAMLQATVAGAAPLAAASTAQSGDSSAVFSVGASRDKGATSGTAFVAGDTLVVAGVVVPESADMGKTAEIFVVVTLPTPNGEFWLYRALDGSFRPWNGQLASLGPAYTSNNLSLAGAWEIYSGGIAAGDYRVFLGYRAAGSELLHFTTTGLLLQATNP